MFCEGTFTRAGADMLEYSSILDLKFGQRVGEWELGVLARGAGGRTEQRGG